MDLSELSRLATRIPKGTWDTHMHVVDPSAFPLAKDARYRPAAHTLEDAQSFLGQLGIQRMVIVQPSIYGNDNSCTLDGLHRLGPELGRAVVQFDVDKTSADQLREWHLMGVRGVRLNFKSVGAKLEQTSLATLIRKYAEAVRDLGWVLDLYIALEDIPLLELAEVKDVKICIAHIGHPSEASVNMAKEPEDLPGLQSLLNMLRGGHTWVKLSGTYRIDVDDRNPVVNGLIRELVRTRPDRCLFATDWPHTRYDGMDVVPYLKVICDVIEEEGVSLQQVLVDNANELFGGN